MSLPLPTLHIWPAQWDLPSIEPASLAAVLYLQLSIPGGFNVVECANPDLSPSGSTVECAKRTAWSAHIESTFGDLVAHMFYSLPTNYNGLTYPALASFMSVPQRYYVPQRVRNLYHKRLEASGLWNLPGEEVEDKEAEKRAFGQEEKKKEEEPEKIFKSAFERQRVLERARAAFDLYARLLDDNRFFYYDRPTSLDVLLAAHTLLLLHPPFPDPLLPSLLSMSYPTLLSHARLVLSTAFPGSTAPSQQLHILPPHAYSLRSLLPYPSLSSFWSGGGQPKTERSEEDKRFDRMRWAWIGMAVLGSIAYWSFWGPKIIIATSLSEDEEDEDGAGEEFIYEVDGVEEEGEDEGDEDLVMAPIRLRHPKGVTTIELDFDTFTVLDLQQEILAASEIPPSAQDLKAGYPPRSLTGVIPELPLSSLGLSPGEQIIVTQKPGPSASASSSSAPLRPPLPTDPRANIVNPPASLPSPSSTGPSSTSAARSDEPDYVETPDGGYLVHRIVPDDNSCLFSSIAVVFEQDITKAPKIRQIVADVIRNDPDTWTEAILGRPRNDYITTILSPNSWGGAIELTILATYYATEIASIDVETGRIDRFTPSSGASVNRVLLIYSGIHYDAALIAPELGVPEEWCTCIVPVESQQDDDDGVLRALKALADKLRSKRRFTNTATFDLKCEVCGKGLKGEKEARAHASETGHVKFGEY
ncbi:hypothetical protein EW146_g3295 [Bondarzewia mesenterica]|uniref:Ubiquitin thioesterase OTU n=1 Tax=Bondarzewia mesenterica TaxID=1095465 RepID=A0A4V3XFH4_9AGAM|nr:hypothetical protein EW146_g3295 [Bondarzewia mesenterica]